ncbi:hypothetical protein H0E84_03375 [Luteimonas sp. SJ-92]|uniref:Uncharacterized protein n=1 Tax=Luteimonas salinisoli TaxID=2752307 RepID=A0A853J9G1_9GAMM|nr:hypothetical protein [Luteimonas salinisoli]NZA25412.1 hypothetical protein [Luteimonas salinisoli]
MEKQKEVKLFAFKLAKQKEEGLKPQAQWKVRDSVSVAGCTTWLAIGPSKWDPDGGMYC